MNEISESRFAEPTDHEVSPRRLPPLLRRAWYSLNQAFRRRISHLDITPDQFTVLRWLHEDTTKGMTQRDLARLMASDPNTVTSVLSRMEAAKLISRQKHESDRRAKRVTLTAKGEKAYLKARDIAIELQTNVLSVIPESQMDQFLKQLEQVGDAARTAADDES